MAHVNDGRYHKEIYWPAFIVVPHVLKLEGLYATNHVRERFEGRAAAIGSIPKNLYPSREDIIECTIEDGKYTAILFRVPCTRTQDAVYVVNPSTRRILTVWLNSKSDQHPTLDKTLYRQRP